MKDKKPKAALITLLFYSAMAFPQACPPEQNATPAKGKFDFNFAGCYNYYAVDLGVEEANKKCRILSKTENFNDPSFSACNNFLQPSRSNWKADVADRCLDLAKKIQFQSKSFNSCVEHFSISSSDKTKAERKIKIEVATERCMALDPKIDFTSKSFISCFSLYGGNSYPLGKAEADNSIEITDKCSGKISQYDYSNNKLYNCWNKNRIGMKDRNKVVEDCVLENP